MKILRLNLAAGLLAMFCWSGGFAALSTQAASTTSNLIDFNRDIRPILSENCFLCHGPDEQERKAKLRLDIREEALKPARSGERAIVPGDPSQSELLLRVAHSDPDELMPPPKSGKKISAAQVELLRRWIQEGAPYATHWSYAKPIAPPLPKVQTPAWPQNGLDFFILARLEREGLAPMPEADRYSLARRAALDLTGLPPTLEEVEAFVKDTEPRAYERFIDLLLAKKSFGEHWARLWMDLARYADSAGYADDPLRTIWAYRDYVINAFNDNKPFDQFTLEQIAGDLLPNPSEEQLIATAFHRNTMTNSEGGTNDEEFRNAAIIDRVNTTMAVWMGTSMACAQCHTHKYDPISQEEYFQFFALLNNTEDADRNDESPLHRFFSPTQKEHRHSLEQQIASLAKTLSTPTPALEASFTHWRQSFPKSLDWRLLKPAKVDYQRELPAAIQEDGAVQLSASAVTDTATLELPLNGASLTALRLEALPTPVSNRFILSKFSATLVPSDAARVSGRFVRVEIPGKDKILSLAEVQVFNGADNLARRGDATQSSTSEAAPATLAIDGNTNGDFQARSTTHTKTSENPWWELDLKESRPISRILVWNRTDNNTQSRLKDFRVIVLDDQREIVWERLVKEAPSSHAEWTLDASRPIPLAAAFANTQDEGSSPEQVLAEKSDPKKGWSPRRHPGQTATLTLLPKSPQKFPEGSKLRVKFEQSASHPDYVLNSFRLSATQSDGLAPFASVEPAMLTLLSNDRAESATPDEKTLFAYFLRHQAPELAHERKQLSDLNKKLEDIKPYTVPIMKELAGDKRRSTRLQFRGNFEDLGKTVTEAVPAAFHPLPAGAPPNRLGLAKWLVDPNNPLTPRVIANRFWEQIFGIGLVRTSEEFGSQGEPPSHPDLLDWLAVELVDQQWDVKRFLKLLVTSAAYRQSAKVTPELIERDPDNRLLARGPRFRLSAEMVRDQSLSIAGLLSPKMLGPSVKPPRPASGLSAAFGSSVDWKTSDGEDRFRRGLYTEWRRTSPYPSMVTFDAPNREVCTLRRTRTNTPLQALVTLNDPVYFESAQALGRRMAGHGSSLQDKLRHGFQLCVARPPTDKELSRLVTLFGEALAEYAKTSPDNARRIATEPIGPAPAGGDILELAAWTTVANVLLNLDETLMKR